METGVATDEPSSTLSNSAPPSFLRRNPICGNKLTHIHFWMHLTLGRSLHANDLYDAMSTHVSPYLAAKTAGFIHSTRERICLPVLSFVLALTSSSIASTSINCNFSNGMIFWKESPPSI